MKLASGSDGTAIVVDVIRFRGGPHEVADTILRTAQRDGHAVAVGLPQDPGQAGKQQVAWLSQQLAGFNVVASPETGAKVTRALPVAALAEAGRLRLLRAAWNQPLLNELRDFPHGRKDDQVDALSRAFAMIGQGGRPARRMNVALLAR